MKRNAFCQNPQNKPKQSQPCPPDERRINAGMIRDLEGRTILGRRPEQVEAITCTIDHDTLLETSRAFIIASRTHKSDMEEIISAILKD